MRPPQPEGAPRLDVSIEELEAWLERARPALGAEGYEKLRAAIRTLGYVTELLEKQEPPWRRCASCCVLPARRKPIRC